MLVLNVKDNGLACDCGITPVEIKALTFLTTVNQLKFILATVL